MSFNRTNIPKVFLILPVLVFLFLAYSCNPTRKIKEGQLLLNRVEIINREDKISKTDIEAFIKQKPNRKIFGLIKYQLALYNTANEEKVKRKREAWQLKRDAENAKRLAAGKKIKAGNHFILGQWLMDVGEAPVIYDSTLLQKSASQIGKFFANKGYFYNKVSDTTIVRGKKAKVIYTIIAGKPYKYRKVNYEIDDEQVNHFVQQDMGNCLLSSGQDYDVDIIQKERERLTRMLNNKGYFTFSKEFIYFKIDSALNSRLLDITIGIKKNAVPVPGFTDSIVEMPHQRFSISNIYIDTEFDNFSKIAVVKDTLRYKHYFILYKKKLKFRPTTLTEACFISKGDLYQLDNAENTYKRLSVLKAFRFVNIKFMVTPGTRDSLTCLIQLHPLSRQSATVEAEGTNTGGNLGLSGSLIYQNQNVFKGAELFEIRLRGGVEDERLLGAEGGSSNLNLKQGLFFNTVEFGPEVNLYIPKFLAPYWLRPSPNSNPKTIFTFVTNYQNRPDFNRLINKVAYGYTWKPTKKISQLINPLEVSQVKVALTPSFQSLIDQANNVLILNAYSPHLVTDSRYSFVYNDQSDVKLRNHIYFKFNIESSGNILRGIYDLNHAPKDSSGRYLIMGIPFSQYIRSDIDFRFNHKVSKYQSLAFRAIAGVGKALDNLETLPFEKSFYGGGANDIRAWVMRSLGPGSYTGNSNFDQIGDMQLEANAEYRMRLFKQLNGAMFVDAGNIWLLKNTPGFAGGNIDIDRFYKEIAVGTGLGARLDFSYFIIRFDVGLKVYDPSFPEESRFVLPYCFDAAWKAAYLARTGNSYAFLNYNIGIGYPF